MDNKLLMIIIAILLPPLAVFMKSEDLGKDFIINVLLTILGWLPGAIHALWYVTKD